MFGDKNFRRVLLSITAPIAASTLLFTLLALMLYTPAKADASAGPSGGPFPLIVGTSLNATGTNHDLFEIDVVNDISQTVAATFPVWGATYDAANNRVLFTSSAGSTNGDQLWEWPVGGTLNNLGTIIDTSDSLSQRIDGLAISGGVLYGSHAGGTVEDGLWIIDTNTLSATLVFSFSDSISGIDADPNTGTIYGVNDTTASLVEIDPGGMTITPVTPYPIGVLADVDGLAVSPDGRAYFITDEPGSLYVYNLNTASYETSLTAPWTSADTFSGGAYIDYGSPGIAIDKSPDDQTLVSGANASFTIVVTNTGNITLTNVTVTDAQVPACDNSLGDLGPGASSSYGCVDAGVTMSYTNMAEVTGLWMNQVSITDTDTATVTVIPAAPDIVIEKSPDDQSVLSGSDANFTIAVTNTGNITLTNVMVSDAQVPACDNSLGDLGPGASSSYGCVDVGVTISYTNLAEVTGLWMNQVPITDTDTATVTVTPLPAPDIVIEKSPDDQSVLSGSDANFTIAVTNTGNITLTNVMVSDAQVPACDNSLGDLGPGASSSYGCVDVGVTISYTNLAEVTGLWMNQVPITDTDTATVTVIPAPAPSIVVTKTVGTDPNTCATTDSLVIDPPNMDVTYCYTVQNTGNITLTTHDVVDDQLGALLTAFPVDLAPGGSFLFTTTTNITQSVTNVVTWTASIVGGPSVSDTDTATVTEQPTDVSLTGFDQSPTAFATLWLAAIVAAVAGLGLMIRRKRAN